MKIKYKYGLDDPKKREDYLLAYLTALAAWYISVFHFIIPYLNPHGFYEKFLTTVLAIFLLILLTAYKDKIQEIEVIE